MELSEEERSSQECRFLVTSAKKRIKRNICTVVGGYLGSTVHVCTCVPVFVRTCSRDEGGEIVGSLNS